MNRLLRAKNLAFFLIVPLLALLLATACGPSKAEQLNNEGNEAFAEQAFQEALVAYQSAQIDQPELADQFMAFMVTDAFQSVIPTTNWMYPAVMPKGGLPQGFEATRYHSLIVERGTLPECLEVTAALKDGTIMGLQHRDLPIHGVQFHPESFLTEHGHALIKNWLDGLDHGGAS